MTAKMRRKKVITIVEINEIKIENQQRKSMKLKAGSLRSVTLVNLQRH